MELLFALMIGVLFSLGLYMMLRRSIVKLIIGISLIGNAGNLLVFFAGNMVRGKPPILKDNLVSDIYSLSDPLTQSLILTAIVISFGVTSFGAVLINKAYDVLNTDDVDTLTETDSSC